MDHNIPVPPPAHFNDTEDWEQWLCNFERYKLVSGLHNRSSREQVATLMYVFGPSANAVVSTLGIDEDKDSYKQVCAKLNKYFAGKRNVIADRARFNRRTQRDGESIEDFIRDLHQLADRCSYGNLRDELIRDRIVVGVRDDGLSDKLQSKEDLSLADAIRQARQFEERKKAQNIVRNKNDVTICHVNKMTSKDHRSCSFCGGLEHPRMQCPARNAVCSFCKKPGHFQKVCRQRQRKAVHQLDQLSDFISDSASDLDAVGVIDTVSSHDSLWFADVSVNGHITSFKIDTGAAVSVVSDRETWLRDVTLEPSSKQLHGAGNTKLHIKGVFKATLQYNGRSYTDTMYVLFNQHCSLLSKAASEHLGIVARVDVVKDGACDFKSEFPRLFTGLGHLQQDYHITLRPDATPVCEYTARKIPHALLPKVRDEIDKMLELGVISPVTVPTEWCSGIVVVPKPNGGIRMCVDLTHLNTAVRREIHPMASVDDSLAKLDGSKVFTKLDANSGFHQIPLDEESKLLTTFITPFGRFCYNRLAMGISSAPEVFQRTMSSLLEGVDGVVCHMDDILIHGATTSEHDHRVRTVMNRLQDAGLTLSNEKCEFSKDSVKFLGHIIDASGIRADPAKVAAIAHFPVPSNVTELQRFMGMVNQLAKFLPSLSEFNEPLRQLLRKDSVWTWGVHQQKAFQMIKDSLMSPSVLAHYSPHRRTVVSTDASSVGIGACLFQYDNNGSRRPVCYISRCLTDTEKNYAVIEKEALAAVWACERLSDYVLGLDFVVETDHKPLVPLLQSTDLSKMPPRILRFRLRMMRFSPRIVHVPGKSQITADAFSRAPAPCEITRDDLVQEMESSVKVTVSTLTGTAQQLADVRAQQQQDPEIVQIRAFCTDGWPTDMPAEPTMKQYWINRQHLTIVDDLLLYDDRLVIPSAMRGEVLGQLHAGHLGINKCVATAQRSVWWPNITASISNKVSACAVCAQSRPEPKEPLISTTFPDRPWSRVGIDVMIFQGKTFLVAVDYYSRWTELRLLDNLSSAHVVDKLKNIFACHGIPDIVVSDNGTHFSGSAFQTFADAYKFSHVTCSPKHSQGNGEVERAIQTLKNILKKSDDPALGVLAYRTAPLHNGLSPSQLLMGRQLRSCLPVIDKLLLPQAYNLKDVQEKENQTKSSQKRHFDRRHRARSLPALQSGDQVWIRDLDRPGTILKQIHARSYSVHTKQGDIRRNRAALVLMSTDVSVSGPQPGPSSGQ